MSKLPTKIEYEERKIGDMPIGRTRFDTIEEKINDIISYLADQGEEKPFNYERDSSHTHCWNQEQPTPVESEWEKVYSKKFLNIYTKNDTREIAIMKFISSLLLTAKEEEQKRIEGVIEGMKENKILIGGSDEVFYKTVGWNNALSDILTAIK